MTSTTVPGAFFFISFGISSVAVALSVYVLVSLKGKKLSEVTAIGAGRESEPVSEDHHKDIVDIFYLSKI